MGNEWNRRYIERNSLICKEFPIAHRVRNLGFKHYMEFYNRDLTPETRAELIQRELAVAGITAVVDESILADWKADTDRGRQQLRELAEQY